jgi:hypothetical protein
VGVDVGGQGLCCDELPHVEALCHGHELVRPLACSVPQCHLNGVLVGCAQPFCLGLAWQLSHASDGWKIVHFQNQKL